MFRKSFRPVKNNRSQTRADSRRAAEGRPRRARFAPRHERLEDRAMLAAGDLDLTFGGGDGMVQTGLVGSQQDRVSEVQIAAQPDGKIVVAGTSGHRAAVARYLADGSLDASFGGVGYVSNFFDYSSPTSLAVQTDGKILVTLAGYNSQDFQVVRYNADGTLDASFDGDGRVATSFPGGWSVAQTMVVQTDGRIVVGGVTYEAGIGKMALARYNTDGSLDANFDGDGLVVTDIAGTYSDFIADLAISGNTLLAAGNALVRYNLSDGSLDANFDGDGIRSLSAIRDNAHGLAIQSDGKIVVANSWGGAQYGPALARYDSSGVLDGSFGVAGVATVNFGSSNAGVDLAVDSSDRLLLSGLDYNYYNFLGARLTANGALDGSFDGDGIVAADFSGQTDLNYAVAVDAADNVLLAGFTQSPATGNDFALARFEAAAGALDVSFGGSGKVTTDLLGPTDEEASDLLVQPDGKILTFGYSSGPTSRTLLARHNPDGSLDASFGDGGTLRLDFSGPGVSTYAAAVGLQSDGKIVVGGMRHVWDWQSPLYNNTQGDFFLARFLNNGALDTSFGVGGIATADFEYQYHPSSNYTVHGDDFLTDLIVTPNDEIIAVGSSNGYFGFGLGNGIHSYGSLFAVAKFDPNGALDASFDGDGKLVTPYDPTANEHGNSPQAVALQPDGKILVSGGMYARTWGAVLFSGSVVVRYNADGSLDATFGGGDGIAPVDVASTYVSVAGLAVQSDGKIVVGGTWYSPEYRPGFALWRLDSAGDLDLSFGIGGTVLTLTSDAGTYGNGFGNMALQADGKIVAAGTVYRTAPVYNPDIMVVRYLSDGSLDSTFGVGGIVVTDAGSQEDWCVAVGIQRNGRLIVSGGVWDPATFGSDLLLLGYRGDSLVDPATIGASLQDTVAYLQANPAVGPAVTYQATSEAQVDAMLAAISNLVVDSGGPVVTITVDLGGASYAGKTVAVPAGVVLVLANGTLTGASPALVLTGGSVQLLNMLAVNATDAPTILVLGGSLVVRQSTIEESSLYSQAAVRIEGGSVDLGTSASPGGNTFLVRGDGEFVHNASAGAASAAGNAFQVDGTPLLSGFRIEDRTYHALDDAAVGLVAYADGEVHVTPSSGSIQRGVDAVAAGGVVRVEGTGYAPYNAGAKLVGIAFEGGPTLTQTQDAIDSSLRTLIVTGTGAGDDLRFAPGNASGAVEARVAGIPTGSFAPTGRLVAYGLGGNDSMEGAGGLALSAWLYGGAGNDRLKGGGGHDVLLGEEGDDLLVGGGGRDLLVGGAGADRLVGNADDDILIAGATLHDVHEAALAAIMAEWTSIRSYSQRVANVSGSTVAGSDNSTFADRANLSYYLRVDAEAATVFDDNAADVLTGAAGLDWFLFDAERDKATDLSAAEFALDIDWILSSDG